MVLLSSAWQQALEERFMEVARKQARTRDTLIILDRGCMDSKAYLSKSEWHQVLDDLDRTEVHNTRCTTLAARCLLLCSRCSLLAARCLLPAV